MSAPQRLLVAVHSADATEDGVVLIDTVRWLTGQDGVDVRVLAVHRGALTAELEAFVPVTVMAELDRWSYAGLVERGLFALRLRDQGFARRAARLGLRSFAPDTVYLHSVLAAQVLHCIAPGPRLVCRVQRDLEPSRWALGPEDQALLVSRVDCFVAEGEVRVRELIDELSVAPERVHEVPRIIVPTDPRAPRDLSMSAEARAVLRSDGDGLVMGGYSPSTTWDPPDLSILLAALRARRTRGVPLTCRWVLARGAFEFWVNYDVERAGLTDSVHVLDADADADLEQLLRHCDVLLHLSRHDEPAPPAYLEAAVDGAPIVCFAGSSLEPFVGGDVASDVGAGIGEGGFVAPYLDVVALAEGLVQLAEDGDLRRRLGAGAARRILDTHSVERYAERLWTDLERRR